MRVAFLWHMHQPDYRDPQTGEPVMPWARLHGLRGYRDLLLEGIEHPTAWTINLVPSLLDQLMHYAEGGSDPHLRRTAIPAEELTPGEVRAIREGFVGGHPVLRAPFAALEAVVRSGRRLSTQELRDLQVWSTLAWFGATARRDHPIIDALRRKQRGFDEADKQQMLQVQASILAELPALWRRLGEAGEVALSASAYHHPILPLVVDTGHARRCLPGVPDVGFAWPEDARAQLRDARLRVEALTGVAPAGLWPSEGAVSPEVATLAREEGFTWLCSDEGVLQASERRGAGLGGWQIEGGPRAFFRDTDLSDRIGFRYADQAPKEAVLDLIRGILSRGDDGLVVIALDGENPWETFPDAGGAFRAALRQVLDEGPVTPVRLDDEARREPVGHIDRLHTGSWIGADLAIWYGHEEDRRAWREVAAARRAAAGHPREAAALVHLYAAEGSDWYWWYGDDFRTPFAGRFDALFRAHLRAAWRALGEVPPQSLERPLLDPDPVQVRPPARWLLGPVDGTWPRQVGSGRVGIPQGAMARGRSPELRFGWTKGPDGKPDALHLWLSGEGQQLQIDGESVGTAKPTLAWRVGGVACTVQIIGPEGPAWPEPVHLAPPEPGALWTS